MAAVIGGIGIFLLGMTMLTNGLKEMAGDALKKWLNKFTGGAISSLFSGIVMTVLVQSSTATTLLTIGFVSAGLLTFAQSIGVIIGANIGSTSTGWIISLIGFKVSLASFSLPMVGIGVFTQLIAPRQYKTYGSILAGFGFLFLGIDFLQTGMANAQDFISFDAFLADSFVNKAILIGIGVIMTIIMQASSAAMAATLTALFSGAIDYEQAIYLVIGQNIGTTATALIASVGASVAAKRTSMTHVVFNVLTALVVVVAISPMLQLTHYVTTRLNGSFDETLAIAVFHTLFSVIGACIFVPLLKPFAALIMRIVPEKENRLTKHLDDSITHMPAIALQVGFDTLQQLLKELTEVVMLLIREKRSTDTYEKRIIEVERALEETRRFLAMVQSSNVRDREKHLNLMHVADHVARLIKVLRDQQHAEAVYLQHETMQNFYEVLEKVLAHADDKQTFVQTASLLENTSRQMADRRRVKREEYFERAITNEVDVEQSTAKVEAILWVDRLIFHFFRSTARMANYVRLDEARPKH
ncbi:MAG: Na/Pi cotransporter family protein [Caryophanon sp.]|nr:Na/Pi cotransporter family protein [Caryophanon sp.]